MPININALNHQIEDDQEGVMQACEVRPDKGEISEASGRRQPQARSGDCRQRSSSAQEAPREKRQAKFYHK